MDYLTISGLLSAHLRHLPAWPSILEAGKTHPSLAGALLATHWPRGGTLGINLGALLSVWWQSPRTVWVVGPATAKTVRDVGLAFVPETPPPSWGGQALIVESQQRERAALVEDVFAAGIYVSTHLQTGRPWYWVFCLDTAGGADVFGIPCDQGPLNARLAARGELLELERVEGDGDLETIGLVGQRAHTPAEQLRSMRILRWLFAFSYFVDRQPAEPGERPPGWSTAEAGTGPLEGEPGKGRPVSVRRRRRPLWGYRTLRFEADEGEPEGSGTGAPLDTAGLERTPTVVRPHWQRVGPNRVVRLIGAYTAHRWRRAEKLGEKVRV
jgi:hypothetical protein